MKNMRAINYFGSKVASAHRYPAPAHETVIEPFAGGAGYSLLHYKHRVILVDASPDVVAAWQYLIETPPERVGDLPLIEPEQDIGELDCSPGGRALISWCLNQTATPRRKLSSWGVYHMGRACYWGGARRKQVALIASRIKHWEIRLGDYTDLMNQVATWYVDPPYVDGGKPPRGTKWKSNYPHGGVDYFELAEWCRSRNGQVIVCERVGADWLPFQPLYTAPTSARFRNGGRCSEAVWLNDAATAQQSLFDLAGGTK